MHSTSTEAPPCKLPKDLTKDTSSRMSPKVAALSVRSSLTCLETSSLWVMSSPASKRAWFQGRAEEPVRIMRKQKGNQEPTSYIPTHPLPSSPCRLVFSWPCSRLEAEALSTHHHGLEDLCSDGGQHSLVIVLSNAGVDAGKLASNRPEKDAQGDVDIL